MKSEISNNFIINELTKFINKINQKDTRINIVLNKDMPLIDNNCPSIITKEDNQIQIGIKELRNPFKLSSTIVLIEKIVVIFHELQHTTQYFDYFNNKKNFTTDYLYMLENQLACLDAHYGYYSRYMNYFTNPREIDSEYIGIINAYEYLNNIYGNEEATSLILEYVNYRNSQIQYFIKKDKPFSTIKEVDISFQEAFEQSKVIPREYMPSNYQKDVVIVHALKENDEFIFDFNKLKNPILQDKLLAALYLEIHTDANKDFTLVDVIQKDLEETKAMIYDKYFNKQKDKNNNYER